MQLRHSLENCLRRELERVPYLNVGKKPKNNNESLMTHTSPNFFKDTFTLGDSLSILCLRVGDVRTKHSLLHNMLTVHFIRHGRFMDSHSLDHH